MRIVRPFLISSGPVSPLLLIRFNHGFFSAFIFALFG